MGVEGWPLRDNVHVLILRTCGCYLIRKRGLFADVIMFILDYLLGLQGDTQERSDRHQEGLAEMKAEIGELHHKPRKASSRQELNEARNSICPRASAGRVVLLINPWIHSGHQNCN